MKSIKMKGKNVEEATSAALAVLGATQDRANIKIISEGKPGIMGLLGGEEAEVEVSVNEGAAEEARQVLQNLLDKAGFLAMADIVSSDPEGIRLEIKGEDISRIIGKEGTMLKSLEIIVGAILGRIMGQRTRVNVDAGGYRAKREEVLQRLAADVAEEVIQSGAEKVLPPMEAADRRTIHLYLQNNPQITTVSRGEGKDRRLVVEPKKE